MKYLFYRFNDYLERVFEPIKPVHLRVITNDDLALEVIRNENWQYFLEILTACKKYQFSKKFYRKHYNL